ncbi:IPT/TIG domain-containing protein [Anaerovirgula multivorans]|uniref:IPT/TIG domain-containing protein n=1 Tax=Anaerovirgula multivorans TaxID=312168 RepID=A0A239CGI2_9FIRM|nr:IPT/TIG domain-containing protein [Anaerovirgula multivorans]SNS18453.1 IPT/TIG domain-containing protein [Anaerovirgula multivorans]
MKMFKKGLSILLSFVFLFTALASGTVSYASTNYVSTAKYVNPTSIYVGEEAEIALSIKGIEPTNVILPNDVILILDKSGSMKPTYEENNGEDKMAFAKEAAQGFIDLMDFTKHRVGVVDYSDVNKIGTFPLTTDGSSGKEYIDAIKADGGTATGDAIYAAIDLLKDKRGEAQPVIVILTDGDATIPRKNSQDKETPYAYAKEAAAVAKEDGIVFYTIALLTEGTNPETSGPNNLLKEMATTAQHHHFVLGSVGLAEIYARIVQEIGRASAYNVIVTDTVAPEFEIVPDSYNHNIPKPSVEGNTLTWNFHELKDEELIFTYKIRHKQDAKTGSLNVAANSTISYLDYTGTETTSNITIPKITVNQHSPIITSLENDKGHVDGGETVIINGNYFRPDLVVDFGSKRATNVVFIDETKVSVTAPSGKQGAVTVKLSNTDGQFATAEYSYWADPIITKINPEKGPITGGTQVRIDGQYFMPGMQVKFGDQLASNVNVFNSNSSVNATTPASLVTGPVDIELINTDGTKVTAIGGFTYEGLPEVTVTSVSPDTGLVTGGIFVEIYGSNFQPSAKVFFGDKQANGFFYFNSTKLRVLAPSVEEAGPIDVKVINGDGQSGVLQNGFTYLSPPGEPAPVISSVTPDTGLVSGGYTAEINGDHIKSNASVYFGNTKAPITFYYNKNKIKVTVPAGAAGVTDIKIVNPDGQEAVLSEGFTYTEPPKVVPTITSITPDNGPVTGGTHVIIEGSNIQSNAKVYFADKQVPISYYFGSSKIRVISPAMENAGAVDVKIVSTDNEEAVAVNGFTYTSVAPTVTSVSPDNGLESGGYQVFINGTNFKNNATVLFGENVAPIASYFNSSRIRVTAPEGSAGAVDVKVINPDGESGTLEDGFTYTEPPKPPEPTITSITPNNGEVETSLSVDIKGTNFASGSKVYIGSTQCVGFYYYNSSRLRVLYPKSSVAGPVDVTVVNPDGQSVTLTDGFVYNEKPKDPPPVITSVTPNTGKINTNSTIDIYGTGFKSGSKVYFGSTQANWVYYVSGTRVRVSTPKTDVEGTVDITIVNPDEQSVTLTDAFTYIQ